ncbi:zinc finger protein 816-like [Pectinophora gossypiella]|uniref:zinc finger protein 816-like n=1 Tax=Pectinophora gossypiella TaxID=13191 RepID=UPI00214F3ED3|nr:zinc finger protein 816-like [Pectinophora gossypiella]
MQVCRVCLDGNTKLFFMKNQNLSLIYEQITGLNITQDCLPHHICWECTQRLLNSWSFRTKALRSHTLMLDILHTNSYLSDESLTSIDRYSNNLTSTLSYKTFDVNHNDLHVHDNSVCTVKSDNLLTKWPDDYENTEKINPEEELKLNIAKDDTYHRNFDDDRRYEDSNASDSSSNHKPKDKHDIYDGVFDDTVVSNETVTTKHKTKLKHKVTNKKIKKKHDKGDLQQIDFTKIDKRRRPANEVLNEDIFTITNLTFEEQMLEICKQQESSNYKQSEFKCCKCYKGFLDEDAFKCHMIRHTDQSGTYECEICKVRFKKKHALRNHMASHVQKFSCRQCTYVTTRRHAAKLHEDYHNGTRYQCPHCQEDFSKFSTYMSHIRIKHPSDIVCELCGHSFISAKGLGLHKKLKHRFDEPMPADGPHCELCDVQFISLEALLVHRRSSAKHTDEMEDGDIVRKKKHRSSTEENGTEKKDTSQKKRHKNTKPEGPIPCEQCDMQLPDSISYYRHFRRSHPDKNRTNYPSMKTKCMCEVCGKMFQSLALLQDHSFTHTDLKQFKCAQCGKCFQRKYRLIAHRRLHQAARASHACSVCGKRFTTASNMQRHMVSHTGLKPFKCEMCGKCFKHASEKRVHITYVHLKKPWPKRSRGKRRSDSRQAQAAPPDPDQDIVQPLWPPCSDPKVNDQPVDKPLYYNLKI